MRRVINGSMVTGLTTAVGVVVLASPASAFPPRGSCTAATNGHVWIDIDSAEVNPTLTQFMSINITEGTTGERTETLTVMNTVTTSIGASTEATMEWDAGFAKVSAKVGFEVQRTTSSTNTETTTMRWTFGQPGYYGLYKGTRAVTGVMQRWRCIYQYIPGIGTSAVWWNIGQQPYTTFANIEAGTIGCGDPVPSGSLRERARMQLGC